MGNMPNDIAAQMSDDDPVFYPVVMVLPKTGAAHQKFTASAEYGDPKDWFNSITGDARRFGFASWRLRMRWPKCHEYELIPHPEYKDSIDQHVVYVFFDASEVARRGLSVE